MKGMVIDPRQRLQRRWFLYDIILPNIGALIAIITLRVLDLGPVSDLAIGAILALLVWSGNFAAPMARLHDLGVPGWWHLVVVAVVFLFATIGPVSSLDELSMRVGDWIAVLRGGESAAPPVQDGSARIGAIIGLVQFLVLAVAKGQKGPNRFGPDPRTAS
jgi:uncharacterized membrane protein YhaH (DUF805 family)